MIRAILILIFPLSVYAHDAAKCELDLALRPLPMLSRYIGEDRIDLRALSTHSVRRLPPELQENLRRVPPTHVIYLPVSERDKREVRIGVDGLFHWENGDLVSAGTDGIRALFVLMKIDGVFRLFLWPESERRRYHHSTLSAGQEVWMAGEMIVRDGRLLFLSNKSGHYEPPKESLFVFERWLRSRGADFSRAEVRPFVAH